MEQRDQEILQRARRLLQAGDLGEAELELARLAASAPHEARILQGQLAFLRGQLTQAASHFEVSLGERPDDPLVLAYLAGVRLQQEHPGDALQLADRALALDSATAVAHYNRGRALKLLERPEEAISALEQAVALDGENHGARLELAATLHGVGRSKDALFAGAELIEKRPFDEPAYQLLCQIYIDLGQPEVAQQLLEEVLAVNPLLPGLQLLLAEILLHTGRHEALQAKLPELWEVCWEHPTALGELGTLLAQLGLTDRAEAAWRRVLELDPDDAGNLYRLGNLAEGKGEPEEAARLFTRACAVAPAAWEPRNDLALLKMSSNDPAQVQQAIALLREAAELAPLEPAVALNLAMAWLMLGGGDEATPLLRKVQKLTPEGHPHNATATRLLARLEEAR
ncbi:MAG: tetratricopeptide repeat protein [Myxococcota bacterium]|jgi:tetratricopeptide (TPR) repeat protein|nr:tetratricopeptide repeat protein [Myxococcota bacterium]